MLFKYIMMANFIFFYYWLVSVRSDSALDTSPEFVSQHRLHKRRIHRSSAPATLSSGSSQITSPSSVVPSPTIKPEPLEELSNVVISPAMDSEPSVSQELDLEIEGGGVDTENIDPGTMECMEVEEEEDINGDVIRCVCNESEEGGFMIQVIFLSNLTLVYFVKEALRGGEGSGKAFKASLLSHPSPH